MSKFPKTIYVVQNGEGDDAFLSVIDPETDDLHEYNDQDVALYGRIEYGKVRITQEIVDA